MYAKSEKTLIALDYFRNVLEIEPHNCKAIANMITIYRDKGRS